MGYIQNRRKAFRVTVSEFNPVIYGAVLGWWAPRLEAYSDGASVTSLTDQSGNALTMTGGGGTFETGASGITTSVVEWLGNSNVLSSTSFSRAQPFTIAVVAKDKQVGGSYHGVVGQAGSYGGIYRNGSSGLWGMYMGATSPEGGVAANWSSIVAVFNGASSFMYVNGTKYTGNPGAGGIGGGFNIGSYFGITSRFTGYTGDVVLWSEALTDSNASAACTVLQTTDGF